MHFTFFANTQENDCSGMKENVSWDKLTSQNDHEDGVIHFLLKCLVLNITPQKAICACTLIFTDVCWRVHLFVYVLEAACAPLSLVQVQVQMFKELQKIQIVFHYRHYYYYLLGKKYFITVFCSYSE